MRLLAPRSLVAGALAASLVTIPVLAPPASAAPPAPAACGTLGPPVCDLLVTVKALLLPLEPLLAMGIPITDALGATVHGIQSTIEQIVGDPEAVNAQDLAQQIGALLDQLSLVPEPVASTLSLLGLGGLRTALTDLKAALETEAAAANQAAPIAAASGTPTSVPVPAGVLQRAATRSGAVPAVPEGATLDLPELGLPVFGAPVNRPNLPSAPKAAAAERPVDLPAPLRGGSDAGAVAAGVAVSSLLLAGGLVANRARARRGDDDERGSVELISS